MASSPVGLVPTKVTAALQPRTGGLAEAIGLKPNPITDWLKNNQSLLLTLGSDLLSSGPLDLSNLPAAGSADEQRRAAATEKQRADQSKNSVMGALENYGADYQDIADGLASGAIDPAAAWSEMFKRHGALADQTKIDERNRGNAQYLQTPELKAAVESGAMTFADAYKLERGGAGATDFGMTPIWGQRPDGTLGYGVQGSDGQFHAVDTGGFQPMDPRTLYSERAAGSAEGKGVGLNTLNAPTAAVNVQQLDAKTDHVIDTIDKATKQLAWDSTGVVGQTMGIFGGTKAYDLRKTAQTIKSNLGFAELQAMRDSSPTGGALGSIAVQELEALQSTLESLDPNQSEDQLRSNLESIKVLLERQKEFRQRAYEAKYGRVDGRAAGSVGGTGAVKIGSKADYDALPSGTQYIAPDGTTRTKP